MNDSEKYILHAIKTWIWSGFYDPEEVNEMVDDIMEDDADENMLRSNIAPEFDKKATAESSWPIETDCDRLDCAFESLNASGIIALHNAGYTISDGLDEVGDELNEVDRSTIKGYCFCHGQDVECAVAGGGLTIAFGDLDDDKSARIEIGTIVRNTLQSNGFKVGWNGDSETRINISIDWKRRQRA